MGFISRMIATSAMNGAVGTTNTYNQLLQDQRADAPFCRRRPAAGAVRRQTAAVRSRTPSAVWLVIAIGQN
ncbi:hypothetical protein GHK69_04025 [Sinorhizobium meliloti]|uniref:hypothetical protein n=1 Tax=Rhizobium meliloti TaxID=382 RepID=UPI0012962C18|nr:hypothetical protein [Sinorhizobium meliloti]MQW24799.1 hypothetical protein [Sinorhizobium meliloti]